ncbi:N-acetylglucosamine-1-phosphodiester alpha-N-acetylglucosaminidase isoform X2 [Channa argus]|uniref:N-acetylglucosamine-1-phosphodiester alpha-N-acetylglucosaminidase isoform X2 n=1 Tax=Channa argus TaxID=215402 RepID=UPI0035214611
MWEPAGGRGTCAGYFFSHMAAVSVKCPCLWLLLCLCLQLSETKKTRLSIDDDVLLPYASSHGPSHSHRHVRDCQPLIHANTTHESWPSSNYSGLPVADSAVFVTDVPGTSRWVYGHKTVVYDPLRTLSVLEPGQPGGCGMNRRSLVEETAKAAGCLYAQNAGFFKMSSGQCLGNVVSNGRMVQDSGGLQNAQFGIRRDGSLVFGMTLWEVADFLKKHDVINAINLDGGGSSTYVTNGTLASYPSDHCEDSRFRCGRAVSTILCVHQRHCQPPDCSGNGECVDERCQCKQGWQGAGCDSLVCQPPACGPHGVCAASGCVCDAGWRGHNCSQECLPGFYGDGCNQTCACLNGGACDPIHGHCICQPGYYGNTCEQVCSLGFFGLSCAQECHCDDQCTCDPQTGSCNAKLREETNFTLHRAGHCLAKQMFTSWREEDEAHRAKPYLTERSWLVITLTLAFLLSALLLFHLVKGCGNSAAAHFPQTRDYSYVPLTYINGAASQPGADVGKCSVRNLGLDDLDSDHEVWSQSRSGRSVL